MPKTSLFFIGTLIFLAACSLQKEDESNIFPAQETDSNYSATTRIKLPNDCVFDSAAFSAKMGLGIFELRLRPYNYRGDSLIFSRNDSLFVMRLYDNKGWHLTVNNQPVQQQIPYFLQPDFGSHYRFIFSGGPKTTPYIQSYSSGKTYQLISGDQFSVTTWNQYWINRFISVNSSVPFLKEPSIYSSKIDSLPIGYYEVVDTLNHWLQLAFINPNDLQGKLPKDTLGWIQWYCNGSIRISLLNDIYMEDYFQGLPQ